MQHISFLRTVSVFRGHVECRRMPEQFSQRGLGQCKNSRVVFVSGAEQAFHLFFQRHHCDLRITKITGRFHSRVQASQIISAAM